MNIKTTFISAIMQLLRLESNIFITGAIEEVVDLLEIEDYKLFIAYLGERESKYEKPIQSITKAVKEFIEIKDNKLIDPYLNKFRKAVNACNMICNYHYNIDKKKYEEEIKNLSFDEAYNIKEPNYNNIRERLINKGSIVLLDFKIEKKFIFTTNDIEFIESFGFEKIVNYGETGTFQHGYDLDDMDKDKRIIKAYIKKLRHNKSIVGKIENNVSIEQDSKKLQNEKATKLITKSINKF